MQCLLDDRFHGAEEGREEAVKPSQFDDSQSIPLNFELVAVPSPDVLRPIPSAVQRAPFHLASTNPTRTDPRNCWAPVIAVPVGTCWWKVNWSGRERRWLNSRMQTRSVQCSVVVAAPR